MELYDKVREVPKEAQKAFNNGSFSGTDINPQYRIMCLTREFGPCGLGWFYDILEHWNEEINNEIHTHVKINLYVKYNDEWSKPIVGIGGNKSLQHFKNGPKASDEGYKMALTDALSVACKALGIGADIYWQNDPTKYMQYYTENQSQQVQQSLTIEMAMAEVKNAKSAEQMNTIWAKYGPFFGNDENFRKEFALKSGKLSKK